MPGEYLLDTNIVIALLNGEPSVVSPLQVATVFVSTIAVGELYFGAFASGQPERNLAHLERLVGQISTLSVSCVTAKRYGDVKRKLRAIGRPIPENDIWIAATSIEHGLTLATRHDHFKFVDGLATVRW